MGELGGELLIVLILTLANGFFSGSEIAIVSARRSRLEQQAAEGSRGAAKALALADQPDRFLATVQVGISLIGTFSAAFGGARIGDILAAWFKQVPAVANYAEPLALGLVVAGLTYLSLILGELVPKRLALQHAERLATISAPIMGGLAVAARPLVALLTGTVSLVLRLLGQGRAAQAEVTEEDITFMIREATTSGSVEAGEAQLIKRVFQFTDRPVRSVMTSRTEMTALPVDTPWPEIALAFVESGYSRLPLYQGSLDHIVGVLHAKDCMRRLTEADPRESVMEYLRPPTFVLDSQHVDDMLATFRRQGAHLGIVIDEYGQVAGVVTMEDLLEELVGEIRDEYDQGEEPPYTQRADGSWLVDAMEPYDKVRDRLGLPEPPAVHEGNYTTLAGLVMAQLSRIPRVGDTVRIDDTIFEVVDMDGRRVDKVLIARTPALSDEEDGG
ncbi:MAG TPA: hemolysin family protein [Herpetosiphonaceae bacterium]